MTGDTKKQIGLLSDADLAAALRTAKQNQKIASRLAAAICKEQKRRKKST